MSVRPRDGGYQADFTHKGVRRREQFATMQEGLAWEADTKAALISGRPLPSAKATAASGEVSMYELRRKTIARYWIGTKNEEGASRNAQAAVDFFGATTMARAITTVRVEEWITSLREANQAGATINRKLAALTKMLRLAKKLGALGDLPEVERSSEAEGRLRFLDQDEFNLMRAMFKHWAKDTEATFVLFLCHTGARLGEALSVRKMDVLKDRVTLGAGVSGSKSGEFRVVPLSAELQILLPALLAGLGAKDQVFGSRINRYGFRSLYMRVRDHVGLGDDVVIHTLRHTCASWLVQRGIDIRRVQQWMGHKSLAMTLRYAKLAPNDLFAAAAVFDPAPLKEAA